MLFRSNVLPRPLCVAFADLTAALTVIFRETIPETAESAAPTANAIPLEPWKKNPITIDNPIAIGMIIFNSRLRNAAAPTLTASEISVICLVPGFCLSTHIVYTPATAKEAIEAITGIRYWIGNSMI